MTYKEIVERLQDIQADMEHLRTRQERDGMLDADDETRWNTMVEEFDDLVSRKYNLEKQADLEKVRKADIAARVTARTKENEDGDVVAVRNRVRAERGTDNLDADIIGEIDSISETRGIADPWDVTEIRLGLTPQSLAGEYRSRAMTAIERMQGTTDNRREAMTKMVERYDTRSAKLSQQLLATSSPSYVRAFGKLAQNWGKSEVLTERERRAVERAMSLADSSGGYLVPFQLDPSVILTSDGSLNEIRQIARQVVATGDVWHGVSAGNVQWSFDQVAGQVPQDEAGAGTGGVTEVSDDTPTFAQPTITVKTARGFVPISLEAFQDESNVAAEIGRLLADGKDELESQVFITGTGNLQPAGLITRLAASPTAEILSASATAFGLADLYTMEGSLPARYRRRASWLANNSLYNLTRQFDTSGGAALWARLGEGRPDGLLGRPAYEAEAMDGTVETGTDNYVLVFGDFQYYVIADRIGMTVEFVPHLFGGSDATHYPTGQRGWFAYYRVGADVTHAGGFRLLNVAADTT